MVVIYIFSFIFMLDNCVKVTDIRWFRQQPKNSLQTGYADICINGTPISM